jgi:hypothetical protein
MKDNIDNKQIGNRKFIIELRFEHKIILLDKRGAIVNEIMQSKLFPDCQWEIGNAEIIIRDNKIKEEARNVILINPSGINFSSTKIDSVDNFYSRFEKIRTIIVNVLGELNIKRIGCRIIGTYKVKSKDFDSILTRFKESFPMQFYIDKYPVKDLLFHLNYQNGMYEIGPINHNDDFFKREFIFSDHVDHIGVAIDTDNYLTNEISTINDKSLIKDIFILSLSVEKDLYSNLQDF